jgi:glyoxylase-like metal-dependent hydrolase (beta-lactamase superfamily II)
MGYENTMNTTPYTLHTIKGYIQSLYLVEYPTKLLLLDSGCYCDGVVVQRYIEQTLGRSFTDLQLVVVTHPHPDHAGGARFYQKHGVPIAGRWELNEWYQGWTGWCTQQVDIFLTHYVAYKRQRPLKRIGFPRYIDYDLHLEIDAPLQGFEDWTVLSTPGHTTMDVSLWHEASSSMYIGDCIVSTGKKYVTPYPYLNQTHIVAVWSCCPRCSQTLFCWHTMELYK